MQVFKGVNKISFKSESKKSAALSAALPMTLGCAVSHDGIELTETHQGFDSSVVTIGNFDGVHLGHQKLIESVLREARHYGVPSVVYTFDPHPMSVLRPDKIGDPSNARLFDVNDQLEQFSNMDVTSLVVEPFTADFAKVSADEFFNDYLVKYLRPVTIVVGHDFSFGAKRQGTISYLEKLCATSGIRLIIIPPFHHQGILVSSSKIRESLSAGEVEKANELLGRNYYLRGRVEKGFQRGRQIGAPTANLKTEVEFAPRKGVYCTYCKYAGKIYPAITNIGLNPTFEEDGSLGGRLRVETHIFDFDQDIYGAEIQIFLSHFLRDEKKFADIDALKNQIQKDLAEARRYFDEPKKNS